MKMLSLSLVAATLTVPALLAAQPKRTEPDRGGSMDLSSQEIKVAQDRFKLAPGYAINLFASEKEFPDLANPVSMTFDARGRLWVSTMPTYPQYNPPHKPNDKILILEDTDGDGKADKLTEFASGLHLPTGFEIGNGGVFVASQPNLLFLKDTDGDDKADESEIVLHGLGSEDSHHAVHAFHWGPDGGLYIHEGTFHASQVETPNGVVRLSNAGIFRLYPRTWQTGVFVSYPFNNPWGQVFDRWGQNFIADASDGANYFGSPISGRVNYPDKHTNLDRFIPFSVRPTAGCVLVSSRHFPESAQGNFLFNNCIGFHGVKQYTVREDGAGFRGNMIEDLVDSSDPNFRPVALRFAPDGSLFLVDWFNPLIGHMQYSLRDERRDHSHGRIWRVTYPDRALVQAPKIAGASIPELLENLKIYEDDARYRTRRELNERNRNEVAAALRHWTASLPSSDPNHEHHLLEALWVYQTINIVNDDTKALLAKLLKAKEPRARAAAVRVLRFWQDRVDNPLALLRESIGDEFPRVRLEALLTLSFIEGETAAEASEIALLALNQDMDYWIDYVLGETMRTLGDYWKPAIASGKPFSADNPKGLEFVLNKISPAELARAARSKPVYEALLARSGVEESLRREALAGLAKVNNTSPLQELEAAISRAEGKTVGELAQLLAGWDAKELSQVRPLLEKLATQERDAMVRQAGYAALMHADNSTVKAMKLATQSVRNLVDLLNSVALIEEPRLLTELFPQVAPLITAPPPALAAKQKQTGGARYIRIELPGDRRTLTLAEVEVLSHGSNIARFGKAHQSGTAYDGQAERAIDGRTEGAYSSGTLTHTPEDQPNPWWEVDLGNEQAVEQVTVWNRTDENAGSRLEGFKILALDANRNVVFVQEGIPAPKRSVTIDVNTDPFPMLRRAAIGALGRLPGYDAEVYQILSPLLLSGTEMEATINSMGKLNRNAWEKDNAAAVARAIAAYAREVPLDKRDSATFTNALSVGQFLASSAKLSSLDSEIKNLALQRITVRAVESQMRFDVTQFFVEAGRPVEILFENLDEMQHNLVIVTPGAQTEIGQAADAMGAGGFAKSFVPDSSKVLFATKLISPRGGVDRLRFSAPETAADYPYICSFPSHWLTMSGVMTVVPRGDSRAGQVVQGRNEPDALPSMAELVSLRGNAAAGREVFTKLCATCHKAENTGTIFAPDLSNAGSRLSREQIIASILDPNADIASGNETINVETKDGEAYSGLIAEETAASLKLRIGANAIQTIAKPEIKSRSVSRSSAMPAGLGHAMSRQELVDLIEYLAAQK